MSKASDTGATVVVRSRNRRTAKDGPCVSALTPIWPPRLAAITHAAITYPNGFRRLAIGLSR